MQITQPPTSYCIMIEYKNIIVNICRRHTYPCGWLGADVFRYLSGDLSYLESGPTHFDLSMHDLTTERLHLITPNIVQWKLSHDCTDCIKKKEIKNILIFALWLLLYTVHRSCWLSDS